jgi:hypothetical protein
MRIRVMLKNVEHYVSYRVSAWMCAHVHTSCMCFY